uniref:PHP domain-containing protein n=1 Tax=Corynebacterium variabile TaxID=1727 RepID=UPI0028A780E3
MNDRPRSFSNHAALTWSRLERLLSGKDAGPLHAVGYGEGGRETLWKTRQDAPETASSTTPFAELHAAGSYNFLRGAGEPDDMVATARRLGLTALALVDRDGFYGAARFATAAAEQGMPTVFGAELSLGGTGRAPLTVLCRGRE